LASGFFGFVNTWEQFGPAAAITLLVVVLIGVGLFVLLRDPKPPPPK
jgi:hypothetical protein